MNVLSQLRVLQPNEMNACEETGDCCQCGTCCIAYRTIVPSIRGDVESVTMVKQAGEVCPQFDVDSSGNAVCLLQSQKDHPSLSTCRSWRGNLLTDEGNITYFEHMCRATAGWLALPAESAHVDRIVELLEKNAIPQKAITHAQTFATAKPLQIVAQYIRCRKLPQEIMLLLHIPDNLRSMSQSADALAWQIGLGTGHPFYEPFMRICCPWSSSREADVCSTTK